MKQTINVKGMHCKSCEMLITDSLEELSGVRKVLASEKKGIVEVEFDEKQTNLAKIKSIIKEEGYKVEN